MLIKSYVLAVTSDVSFYSSSADMSSPALIYLTDTWRLLLWAMDVGSMQQRTASIVQVIMQCMRTQALLSPLYFDPLFQLHHEAIFGFLVTTWSQILQLLRTGGAIWAQLCSCPECWVHIVCCWWCWPKHKFTGCLNILNKMGDVANILLGRPTIGGILCRTLKMDELQVVGHI